MRKTQFALAALALMASTAALAEVKLSGGLDMSTSSHTGRRTFITTLANKGVSVRLLASLAGYRSISTTQEYIFVNDDLKRRAVELA